MFYIINISLYHFNNFNEILSKFPTLPCPTQNIIIINTNMIIFFIAPHSVPWPRKHRFYLILRQWRAGVYYSGGYSNPVYFSALGRWAGGNVQVRKKSKQADNKQPYGLFLWRTYSRSIFVHNLGRAVTSRCIRRLYGRTDCIYMHAHTLIHAYMHTLIHAYT